MVGVAVVADDLSGAVESAATFLLRTSRIFVALDAQSAAPPGTAVHVLDTDTRSLPGAEAARRVELATRALAAVPLVVKKVDSLLRGNLAAELAAVRRVRPQLVVAPALPAAGRTVLGGVVHLDGVPLHRTDAWRVEAGAQPGTVADVLAPLPTRPVGLEVVRGPGLARELRAVLDAGAVPVCDAVLDEDLDRLVAAAASLRDPVLAGSAAIAAAVARTLPGDRTEAAAWSALGGHAAAPASSTLVVVGSAAPNIPDQLATLQAGGARVVLAAPEALLDPHGVDLLRQRVGAAVEGLVVVAVDPAAAVDPRRAGGIARGLAAAVADPAAAVDGLVLTGGETARAVLDRLAVTSLQPLVQVHHGAVVSAGPAGQLIATRPGSFGGHDSLLTLVRAVQTARAHHVKEPA